MRPHPLFVPLFIAAALFLPASLPSCVAHAAPVVPQPARAIDQARFTVTAFATGLWFPTSMAELPDGSLLVAESVPLSSTSPSFFSSEGRLVRLIDTDGDGVADGPPVVLADGLPGSVTSVVRQGDVVAVMSTTGLTPAITLFRTGSTSITPFTPLGRLDFAFPTGFEHTTSALAIGPSGPGTLELYFNVGSKDNAVATPLTDTVSLTAAGGVAMAAAALLPDSVYRVVITDSSGSLSAEPPVQIARGLRNAAGLVFDQAGSLLLQDNGIDTPGNRGVSFSADELNRVAAADLGVTVLDFGFASSYVDSATGELVGAAPGLTPPLLAFLPQGGRRSEGATELALAPAGFPADLADGVFVPFFGMWGRAGLDNEENPLVWADPATGDYFHFFDSQIMGHPYGVLATAEQLYLADMTAIGRLSGTGTAAAGTIFVVTPVPEPAAIALGLVGVVLAVWRIARRSAVTRVIRLDVLPIAICVAPA
jgi:glucose/arabinose dehydrogenase